MVMLRQRRLNLRGITLSQYRVLDLLSSGRVLTLPSVVRLSGMSDDTLIVGEGSTVGNGFRHSLQSLGFVAERNGSVSITDGGREFLSGLSL